MYTNTHANIRQVFDLDKAVNNTHTHTLAHLRFCFKSESIFGFVMFIQN